MSKSRCIIPGCGTSGKMGRELNLSFHEIPCSKIREKWLEVINLPNVRAEAKVCSLHFREDDFRRCVKKRVLKPSAVPSLFVNQQLHLEATENNDDSRVQHISELILEEFRRSEAVISSSATAHSVPPLSLFSYPSDVSHLPLTVASPHNLKDSQLPSISNLAVNKPCLSVLKQPEPSGNYVNDSGTPTGAAAIAYLDECAEVAEKAVSAQMTSKIIPSNTLDMVVNSGELLPVSRNISPDAAVISLPLDTSFLTPVSQDNPTSSVSLPEDELKENYTYSSSLETYNAIDHCYCLSPSLVAQPVNVPAQPVNVPAQPVNVPAQPVNLPAQPVNLPAQPVNLPAQPVNLPDPPKILRNPLAFDLVPGCVDIQDTWSGPEAFNQAMDVQEKRMLNIENGILKRKICELNLQHKKSLVSLRKENLKLKVKLKSSVSRQKLKKETQENLKASKKLPFPIKDSGLCQFAKLREDAKDKKNIKANLLMDQIKMYGFKKTSFSDTTLAWSKNWFDREPQTYNHLAAENFLALPSEKMLKEFIGPSDDPNDMKKYVQDMLLKESEKLRKKEEFFTLHVDLVKTGDCSDILTPSLLANVPEVSNAGCLSINRRKRNKVHQPRKCCSGKSNRHCKSACGLCFSEKHTYSHFVAFVLTGVTLSMKTPCAFYPLQEVHETTLCDLTKTVIRDVEKLGFFIVRLITSHSSRTSSLFKELGVEEFSHIVHPNDPARILFVSYDSNEIVKDICDKFVAFALVNSDDCVKGRILGELQKQRSSEVINPASHFLLRFLKKNVKCFNLSRCVEVFSDPIILALAELKARDVESHSSNHEFLEMLERWHSIENILHASQNPRNKEQITSVTSGDERIMWLKQYFGEYLKSMKYGTCETVILSSQQDLLNALTLCNFSTLNCLQYLVKTKNDAPLAIDKQLKKHYNPVKSSLLKRPRCGDLGDAGVPKGKKLVLSSFNRVNNTSVQNLSAVSLCSEEISMAVTNVSPLNPLKSSSEAEMLQTNEQNPCARSVPLIKLHENLKNEKVAKLAQFIIVKSNGKTLLCKRASPVKILQSKKLDEVS